MALRHVALCSLGLALALGAGCSSRDAELVAAPEGAESASESSTAQWQSALGEDGQQLGSFGDRVAFEPTVDPAYPTVPADVDLSTTDLQLSTQALLVAYDELAAGTIGSDDIEARKNDILLFWEPQVAALKEILAHEAARRAAWVEYEIRIAKGHADWQARIDASEADYAERIADEKLKTIPLLPKDVQQRLLRLQAGTSRSACKSCTQ